MDSVIPAQERMVKLLGGPNGGSDYLLPHLPTVGFRIVMSTDPHGRRYRQSVIYEVKERSERRGWLAGYAGLATDEDAERWMAGPA